MVSQNRTTPPTAAAPPPLAGTGQPLGHPLAAEETQQPSGAPLAAVGERQPLLEVMTSSRNSRPHSGPHHPFRESKPSSICTILPPPSRHIVQYGNDPEFPFPTRPDHSPCRARLRSSPGGTDARRGKQQFVKRDIRVRRRLLCPALSSVLAGLAREHFSAWNRTSVGKIDSPGTAENRPPAKGERFSHRYCCTEQRSFTAPRRLPSGRSV